MHEPDSISGKPLKAELKVPRRRNTRPGVVADTCNPSALGGQGKKIVVARSSTTSLGSTARPHVYKKKREKKEEGRKEGGKEGSK